MTRGLGNKLKCRAIFLFGRAVNKLKKRPNFFKIINKSIEEISYVTQFTIMTKSKRKIFL